MLRIAGLERVRRRPDQLALDRAVFDDLLKEDRRAQRPRGRCERGPEMASSSDVELAAPPIKRAQREQMLVEGLLGQSEAMDPAHAARPRSCGLIQPSDRETKELGMSLGTDSCPNSPGKLALEG